MYWKKKNKKVISINQLKKKRNVKRNTNRKKKLFTPSTGYL